MKDDKLYLIHIKESIERIEDYTVGLNLKTFLDTPIVQDAVLRNLQVLAESTQRLSEKIKTSCPEIEWYKISGLRNVLVHDYLGIDPERVWIIIDKDLPQLKQAISSIL